MACIEEERQSGRGGRKGKKEKTNGGETGCIDEDDETKLVSTSLTERNERSAEEERTESRTDDDKLEFLGRHSLLDRIDKRLPARHTRRLRQPPPPHPTQPADRALTAQTTRAPESLHPPAHRDFVVPREVPFVGPALTVSVEGGSRGVVGGVDGAVV